VDVKETSKKSDFNPASTQYHWCADEKKMILTAAELTYKSMVNLRLRRQSEYEKSDLQTDFVTMSGIEKTKYMRLVCVLRSLDQSILKLDDTLTLLTIL
jgi:hypothetical protein